MLMLVISSCFIFDDDIYLRQHIISFVIEFSMKMAK